MTTYYLVPSFDGSTRSTIPIWHSAGSMNGAWFARCCLGHVLRGEVMPKRPTDRRPARERATRNGGAT